jgi:malonyl-CoA O-methyltransferase
MISPRNAKVAEAFAARAGDYEQNASLQSEIAGKLARLLPELERPKVLEIGCGTGFLTRHLLERYPHGDFLITDIAPEMLEVCRARIDAANARQCRFAVMDGEEPDCGTGFDLIALSMTLQWFAKPDEGLHRLQGLLKPGGYLLFATTGPDSFPEWRGALDACGLPCGLIAMPRLPGVMDEETRKADYGGGVAFLKALKAIGAITPHDGYDPLSPGRLRAALRCFEHDHGGQVSWRIVYGRICAEDFQGLK